MKNAPPPARELATIDQELVRLDARRGQLLARRAYLLSAVALRPPEPFAAPDPFAPPTAPLRPARPPHLASASSAGHAASGPHETSPPHAQNALLVLGGVLLAVAAIAFTLVSWGRMGIGGRAAVLTGVTLLALAAPVPLLRRGLGSTAEAVAALGLVLTVLDAYALYRVGLPGTDALGYTAAATAVLAALWAGYGTALGALRGPLPVAVLTAQLPLPLWALADGAAPLTVAWALLVTAALDTALVPRTGSRTVRGFAGAAAGATGAGALLTAGALSVSAGTPLAALGPAVLLLAGAALGLLVALRGGAVALVCAAVAGLAAVAGGGAVPRTAVPDGWAVPVYLFCGAALVTVVRTRLPRAVVRGAAAAAGAVGALSVLWALPSVAVALLGGVVAVPEIWTGMPAVAWPRPPAAPVVLLTTAVVLAAVAHRARPESGAAGAGVPTGARTPALCGSLAIGWAGILVLPLTLDAGYPLAVAVPQMLTAAALAVVVGPRVPGGSPVALTALGCALTGSVGGSLMSLGTRAATVTALGVMAALFTGAAVVRVVALVRADSPPSEGPRDAEAPARVRSGARPVAAILAGTAVGYTTALVATACAAAGLPAGHTALAVLVVPAGVALLGHVRGARPYTRPVAAPVEITAAGAALLAVLLASGRASGLALVLALCGVIAAGTAVRPERRTVAGYTATALFVLAAWVRLAASDVSVPEAYTLPVTVPALLVGLLRRRRDPRASSWTAYGPGLMATLLPSLLAAWGDTHWSRPLLLGLGALALTLVGARTGLQAPLVLGGAVLGLVAVHELAPYVVQVVGALPRWLPPALAGLLLLAVGATYEQRLKDARRVRRSLGRMR
ncbi:SCO7613 C-terminal domain-containing membrane protein [Streptomyces sp. NPDC002018]|uniref:SCO7613 C-terminal domain-containing membrane protein n=1 Tax=Streptomyces sp. NPDC002018 TaxID=3364629 RepID=UPI0036A1AF87